MSNFSSKREAQERADRIRAFREDLCRLETEQVLILSPEQREAVDRHLTDTLAGLVRDFDIDATESQKQISWGMRVVSLLGGVALCAAAVLFFYRCWGLLSTPVQVVLLILTPLLALAGTEFAARREKTLYYASLVSLVAVGGFILNLSVLGTVFNLPPAPAAFLAWGAFSVAVAYAYGLRLPLVVGLLFLEAWLAAELTRWMGWYWQVYAERPESIIPGGLLVFAASWLAGGRKGSDFALVYRLIGLSSVLLAVLALSIVGRSSALSWSAHTVELFYQFVGLALSMLAIWLGVRAGQSSMVNLGAGAFTLFLYVRLLDWWWDWMPKYLIFLIIGLLSLGLLALFRRLRSAKLKGVRQ